MIANANMTLTVCAKPHRRKTERPLTSVLAIMIHAYGTRSHKCPKRTWKTVPEELNKARTMEAESGDAMVFTNVAI